MIKVSMILVAYIQEVPGHKDHTGSVTPYVIKSHETDKILSSHATKLEAKKHLMQMHTLGI